MSNRRKSPKGSALARQAEQELLNLDDDQASNASSRRPVVVNPRASLNNSLYECNGNAVLGGQSPGSSSASSNYLTRMQCKRARAGKACPVHNPLGQHRRKGVRRSPNADNFSEGGDDLDEGLYSDECEDHHLTHHEHFSPSDSDDEEDIVIRRKIYRINRIVNNRRTRLQESVSQAVDRVAAVVPQPVKHVANSVLNVIPGWVLLLIMLSLLSGTLWYFGLYPTLSTFTNTYHSFTTTLGSWISGCFCRGSADGTIYSNIDIEAIGRIDRLEEEISNLKASLALSPKLTREEAEALLKKEIESFKSSMNSFFTRIDDVESNIGQLKNEVTSALSDRDAKESIISADVERSRDMITSFLARLDMIEKKTTSYQSSSSSWSSSSSDTDLIKRLIQEALDIYDADKTGLPDFALETAGASIVSAHCSETFAPKNMQYKIMGIPIWSTSESPRVVIQSGTIPGQCWAFKGSEGCLTIKLARQIIPTAVAYEHAPKRLSFTQNGFDSAPREIEVLGHQDESTLRGEEGAILLGRYNYTQDGPDLQQFLLQLETPVPVTHISFKIHSNWGNPNYTCLYRFRVHGMIPVDYMKKR